MSARIPDQFICPITNDVMTDPVIDPDGNSYERRAILDWLQTHQTSPITRNFLLPTQLVPNRALRNTIEAFMELNPDAIDKDSKSIIADLKAHDAKRTAELLAEAKDATTVNAGTPPLEDAKADSKEDENDPPLARKPLMLFTVIDTSGSMQEPCGGHAMESDGYSRLDLVKHTLNTLFTSLSSYDYGCVVKFSTVADVFIPLTRLTGNNKRLMIEKLKHLEPENQTNLWDGLRLTIDEIAALGDVTNNYNVQVYVLTDGEPNINPPGNMSDVLRSHIERRCRGVSLTINTFGYGYKLDSEMLFNLSRVGNGFFGFIPDATMVGTVFINALANSTMTEKVYLNEISQACVEEFVTVLYNVISARDVDNRTLLLSRYNRFLDHHDNLAEQQGGDIRTIDFIYNLKSDCTASPDPNLGQVNKAIESRYFNEWGKHYLRSVLSAYINRVCINFKDKGVQFFRTETFIEEQKRIESIFIQLPPPRPSNRTGGGYGYGYGYSSTNTAPPAATNMAQYYDASGGCFSGDSLVFGEGEGGEKGIIAVKDLQKGMKVMSEAGLTKIEAVIQIRYKGSLYKIGEVGLTSYHPIRIDGKDYFPCQCPAMKRKEEIFDGYVYDVVLANRSMLSAVYDSSNNKKQRKKKEFYLATFGHSTKTEIFAHDYFGSEQIVKDLQSLPGWKEGGRIVSETPIYMRDAEQNMRIVSIRW